MIRKAPSAAYSLLAARRYQPLFKAVMFALCVLAALPDKAVAQQYKEERGTLPDGTAYMIRVPNNWNKILIQDLDFVTWIPNYGARALLDKGYAVAGTARHRLRLYRYDPVQEIMNLNLVLDEVDKKFGKPARVIDYGCSGGGTVALLAAEHFPERIDGSIVLGAHVPVWMINSFLDGWFALKVLIGSDSNATLPPQVGVSPRLGVNAELRITNIGLVRDTDALGAAWRQAIENAHATPQGRARIALAFALGKWPAWINSATPEPNLDSPTELEHAMYHTLYQYANQPGGAGREMFENAAWRQQLSWNTDADYARLYENANPAFSRAVLNPSRAPACPTHKFT